MTDPRSELDVLGALRRQWWVVIACGLIAMAAAFAMTKATARDIVVATAVLHIDDTVIGRTPGALQPDDVLRAASVELKSRIRDAGGFSADQISGLTFQAPGKPQTRLVIVAQSSDEATAKKVAKVAAEQAVLLSRDAAKSSIDRETRQLDAAKAALAAMDAQSSAGLTPAEKAALAFQTWQVKDRVIESEVGLEALKNMYRFDGEVSSAVKSATDGLRSTLAGALLLGLFAGVVLAGVREYLFRRGTAAGA